MSWWNSKCTNNNGEYEITFASKHYAKAKAVEKVCCAVIDNVVKSPFDVEAVVRCRECKKHRNSAFYPDMLFCQEHGRYVDPDGYCYLGERKEGTD